MEVSNKIITAAIYKKNISKICSNLQQNQGPCSQNILRLKVVPNLPI